MKKVLLSLSMITVVAVAAIGATGAFFSDTETSTGNTFTAGAIDLKVDSQQHYNGMVCLRDILPEPNNPATYSWQPENGTVAPYYPAIGTACDGTWTETDLGAQKFFNFGDVKPGDSGENTISLHVIDNDAWACVDVNITKNDDVSSTEPELAVDVANTDSIFDGELAQNIKFAAWGETDGDNIWEQGEPLLFSNQSGPASDVLGGKTYALADATTVGGPMTGGTTKYIGLAWCAGNQVVNTSGNTITCDGAAMGNITQTDSMEASIAFRVEQARNNAGFQCSTATQTNPHALRLENETEVTGGPWTIINDGTHADLTWTGDGNTFNYSLTGTGLAATTAYSLIYYADGWPGNNPGAFIGSATTDGSGNITMSGNPDLLTDMPNPSDGNFTVGAKIWLVRSSDYNGGSLSTGPMTAWNPSQYLFEGNVYIHYNDTNN